MRVTFGIEDFDVIEPDVEELVDRLERAGDAEVVLELDGHLYRDRHKDFPSCQLTICMMGEVETGTDPDR
jgi:hypothetical protein